MEIQSVLFEKLIWKSTLYIIFEDEKMILPVDLDQANSRCRIWDTEGRGSGVSTRYRN